MTNKQIIKHLKSKSSKKNIQGMARLGITGGNMLGISVTYLRKYSKSVPHNHTLAQELWSSGIHEARILAALIDDPEKVTPRQMDAWIKDFDSWDVCDLTCANLFDKTPYAWDKAVAWSKRKNEFEKRAGFALMAALAWHDLDAPDNKFKPFFPRIIAEAHDERNFVRKSISWALRQIGKRNKGLLQTAILLGERMGKQESKSARWIAQDALRELRSPNVKVRD